MAIQENPYLPPASRSPGEAERGLIEGGGRTVDAARGAQWIGEGWRMFRADPGTWVLIAVILLVFAVALGAIPLVGHAAATVLMPVLVGGLMLGCRKARNGQALGVSDLFSGFQTVPGPLLVVGAIALGLTALAVVPAALLMVWAGLGAMGGFAEARLIALVLFLALIVPVQMALWFAPALVTLHGVPPGRALAQSFKACLKNIVPFLIYTAILFALAIAASLPLLLGWLVLLPVVIASVYAAYRDIFFSA